MCMTFTVIYVYNNECYQRYVRSIGRGFNCCFGRTGAAISPILTTTSMEKCGLSAIPLFGAACFIGGMCFCSSHLKETGKTGLKDYIEEVEEKEAKSIEHDGGFPYFESVQSDNDGSTINEKMMRSQ